MVAQSRVRKGGRRGKSAPSSIAHKAAGKVGDVLLPWRLRMARLSAAARPRSRKRSALGTKSRRADGWDPIT